MTRVPDGGLVVRRLAAHRSSAAVPAVRRESKRRHTGDIVEEAADAEPWEERSVAAVIVAVAGDLLDAFLLDNVLARCGFRCSERVHFLLYFGPDILPDLRDAFLGLWVWKKYKFNDWCFRP